MQLQNQVENACWNSALLLCLAQILKSLGFETQVESQVPHWKIYASLHALPEVVTQLVAGSDCVCAVLLEWGGDSGAPKQRGNCSFYFSLTYSFNCSQRAKFFRLVILFMLKALLEINIFYIFIKNILTYIMHLILVCIICINKIRFSECK